MPQHILRASSTGGRRQQAPAAHRKSEVVRCAEAIRAYTEAQRQGQPYGVRQGVIIDGAIARAALSTIAYAMDCAAKDSTKLLRRREMEALLEESGEHEV